MNFYNTSREVIKISTLMLVRAAGAGETINAFACAREVFEYGPRVHVLAWGRRRVACDKTIAFILTQNIIIFDIKLSVIIKYPFPQC